MALAKSRNVEQSAIGRFFVNTKKNDAPLTDVSCIVLVNLADQVLGTSFVRILSRLAELAMRESVCVLHDTCDHKCRHRCRDARIHIDCETFAVLIDKNANACESPVARIKTIIYNVTLDVVNSYRFKVQGREWDRNNVNIGTFGRDTNGYLGASGITDAQGGTMTITLVRQQ